VANTVTGASTDFSGRLALTSIQTHCVSASELLRSESAFGPAPYGATICDGARLRCLDTVDACFQRSTNSFCRLRFPLMMKSGGHRCAGRNLPHSVVLVLGGTIRSNDGWDR
jgi:hypothetical protein